MTHKPIGADDTTGELPGVVETRIHGWVDDGDSLRIPLTQKGAAGGVAPLDGGSKVPVQYLPSSIMSFEGVWNAATNTPTLVDGVGDPGQVYLNTVAATRDLGSGPQEFLIGDWVVADASVVWRRSPNSNYVLSVNSKTGAVVLTGADIEVGDSTGGDPYNLSDLSVPDAFVETLDQLGDEVTRATGAEGTLASGLAAEVSRATLAEADLQTGIDTVADQPVVDQTDRYRALRTFLVSLASIDTTPVDVLVGPSDSIGAGAYAGTFPKKFASVLQTKLRQGVQPSNTKGGPGYFPLGASPLLQGDGWLVGVTGTVAANIVDGLGRVSLNLSAGAQLTILFRGTSMDMLYKRVAGAGSFTYTIDGGAPVGPVSAAGATDHLKYSIASGLTSGQHSMVMDITGGPVTIEGFMAYDGDETKGLRVWTGAHSGFGAADFISSVEWVESLDLIPNVKLVVLPIGSNDWYNGVTPATAKTNIESLITTLEGKYGSDVSIVLVSYYDRPAGTPNIPWADWSEQVYQPIADAQDNVTLFDLSPIFGPLLSNTDSRGGLTTASPGDYVHPTPAGHALIGEALADFILPDGVKQSVANNTTDDQKPVSTAQAAAIAVAAYGGQSVVDGGNFAGGAMNFAAFSPCVYQIVANGNMTLAPSGMPPVAAGKAAHHYIQITQDGTGSRTITHSGAFKYRGSAPVLQTAAASVDLLHYFWDGDFWWVENVTTGLPVIAGGNFAGAAAFATIPPSVYQVTATGNITLAASAMPAVQAGKAAHHYFQITQDGTGSRTLTHSGAFKYFGEAAPVLQTAAASVDLIHYFWDGTQWWVENLSGWASKTYTDAQILLASDSGDRGVVVATINNFSGAMNFAAFAPILGKIFNINLTGNATFNITGIPAPLASRGGSFYIRLNQDATGSRTLTLTGFKRAGGAFALSTAANASDLIRFFFDGTSWWAVPVALNGS